LPWSPAAAGTSKHRSAASATSHGQGRGRGHSPDSQSLDSPSLSPSLDEDTRGHAMYRFRRGALNQALLPQDATTFGPATLSRLRQVRAPPRRSLPHPVSFLPTRPRLSLKTCVTLASHPPSPSALSHPRTRSLPLPHGAPTSSPTPSPPRRSLHLPHGAPSLQNEDDFRISAVTGELVHESEWLAPDELGLQNHNERFKVRGATLCISGPLPGPLSGPLPMKPLFIPGPYLSIASTRFASF
jgi:hypothetical protein